MLGPADETPQKPVNQTASNSSRSTILTQDLCTPKIRKLSSNELQEGLRQALSLLRAKDQDLKLAAEIGQSLLESNQQLKHEYEDALHQLQSVQQQQVQTRTNATSNSNAQSCNGAGGNDDDTHIFSLESSNSRMQKELEHLTHELEDLRNTFQREQRQSADDLRESRHECSQLTARLETVMKENQQLLSEKQQFMARSKLNVQRTALDSSQSEMRIAELEAALFQVTSEKAVMEKQVVAGREELEMFQVRYEECRCEIEELQELRFEYDANVAELESLRVELDQCRDRLQQFTESSLSAAAGEGKPELPPNKSLFSEVEDKRVELEKEHGKLNDKHRGLMKAHLTSIKQQERMKNHITRLTQLSSRHGNETIISRLDQMVSQLQSENKTLLSKLAIAEKQKKIAISSTGSSDMTTIVSDTNRRDSGGADDLISMYSLQVKQLAKDVERLERELRALNLMKAAEIDRRVSCETMISKKEAENDQLRGHLAQIQFELDDCKLKLKMAKVQEAVSSDNKEGLETVDDDEEVEDASNSVPDREVATKGRNNKENGNFNEHRVDQQCSQQ